ncbi:Major Facilitator Superfamily protein [Aspergillus parasiticus SU-1]|uniref:Major Facilitator Superfamily protein n=1 Tax=Aspergillus parasiticus (strain ATCC 56775 / NRRL 5862 / SRRC 143 / SU-1) TaxID=1403190 RepID=A0A0F0INL8_ASPPU|nr:Major Facilitator Superfamily protein [Aspergillus parasiticus SU-1]
MEKNEYEEQEEATHVEDPALVPELTQDPNDPLNWTRSEKYLTCLTVCFFTFLSTFNSSNLVVAVVETSDEFRVTPTRAGYIVCFNLLLMGIGNLLWVPLSRVIGKRPVYLLALLLFTGCNIWTYEASTYGNLLASRIISGLAAAAADGTVPSLIADLFFIDERGHCMMIFHFALSTGFFVGPLMCAYITQEAGRRWTSGLLAIASGSTFLIGVFTIRESNYRRDTASAALPHSAYTPRSFLCWIMLTRGFRRDVSFFETVCTTLLLAAYPPILWTGLLVRTFVGWNIVVQMTASRVFLAPPYSWEVGQVGLLALAGFIGAVIAFFAGGKLVDLLSARMTKANGGVREPEFRLPALIIPAVIGPMGVLVFGTCSARRLLWVGAAFWYAMKGFGLTARSNIVVTYAVDSYQHVAGEALVIVFVVRNIIATVLALYTVDWQEATGVENLGLSEDIHFTVDSWIIKDPFVELRRRSTPGNSALEKHVLLSQHSILCGFFLFHLNIRMQSAGQQLITQWYDVQQLAFLYNLVKVQTHKNLSWPDMEAFIKIHGESHIFIGSRPKNAGKSLNRLELDTGIFFAARFARDSRNREGFHRPDGKNPRVLTPTTTVSTMFRAQYVAGFEAGDGMGNIDKILSKLSQEPRPSFTSKELQPSNPQQMFHTRNIGTLQPLALLKSRLAAEEPLILFNYFGMHKRAIELLRLIKAKEHHKFVQYCTAEYVRDESLI